MQALEPRRRSRWVATLDTAFFVLAGVASVWLAYQTLREGIQPGWPMLLVFVFWVLVAYLVLPRLHRILSTIYVPDYFIGRTRTADGLLGDPVNLALRGTADQVHEAMTAAGWAKADPVTLYTSWRIVASTLARRSYPNAPVSPLVLFGRRHDFCYQQEVAGSPSKRHHVRFWRCPPGWLLPGGFAVDWLAAGTFDRSVGLSLFTFQITHKIEDDVDEERDYVVGGLSAVPGTAVTVLRDFSTGYHSRNGGGDRIVTDGDLPVIDLTAVSVAPVDEPPPSLRRRLVPVSVAFGVAMTALRAVGSLLVAGLAIAAGTLPGAAELEQGPVSHDVVVFVGVALMVSGLVDVLLAGATLARRNWARLLLCADSVISVAGVILPRLATGSSVMLHAGLLPVAASVLVLLGLSSDSAREYTIGKRGTVVG